MKAIVKTAEKAVTWRRVHSMIRSVPGYYLVRIAQRESTIDRDEVVGGQQSGWRLRRVGGWTVFKMFGVQMFQKS